MAAKYDVIFVTDTINKAPHAITMGTSEVLLYSPWIVDMLKDVPEEIVKIVKMERIWRKTSIKSIATFFAQERRQPVLLNLGCKCCFRPDNRQFYFWCTNGRLNSMEELTGACNTLLTFASTYFAEMCEDCKECDWPGDCLNSCLSIFDKYERAEISEQNYTFHVVSVLGELKLPPIKTFQECHIGKDDEEKGNKCVENFELLLKRETEDAEKGLEVLPNEPQV